VTSSAITAASAKAESESLNIVRTSGVVTATYEPQRAGSIASWRKA
jgi:hypothetical protein